MHTVLKKSNSKQQKNDQQGKHFEGRRIKDWPMINDCQLLFEKKKARRQKLS